ncbi:acyl carrier protein [Streptomyces bullii]|uniref:Acyl carrier protein n=1 Tax=Streptomyces bullii TaxID=349910 RepID=A0ABW0UR06_9ACTN
MTVDQALLDWFRTGPDARAAVDDDLPADLSFDIAPPSRAALAAADPGERERLLGDYLCQEVGRVLRCPADAVDRDQTMTDLGVGSMTGLELHRRIRAALGVAPELTTILRAENTQVLTRHLMGLLGTPEAGADPA